LLVTAHANSARLFEAGDSASANLQAMADESGTGGSGIGAIAEGFVHIHRNVLGDADPTGGASDMDKTVHRWLNPVARVTISRVQ